MRAALASACPGNKKWGWSLLEGCCWVTKYCRAIANCPFEVCLKTLHRIMLFPPIVSVQSTDPLTPVGHKYIPYVCNILNICIKFMEGIQAHWIQNVQKSLTPILQLKINLWCACPEKGIQVWLQSEWWTKSRADPGELCTQRNNWLPRRFMYFMPGFLCQCRLPAYVLLAKIKSLILLKTGGAEHVPAAEPCSCLLLEML